MYSGLIESLRITIRFNCAFSPENEYKTIDFIGLHEMATMLILAFAENRRTCDQLATKVTFDLRFVR